jgi:hypothetical protein
MFNSTTTAFARRTVLPAVRANSSLRRLVACNSVRREYTALEEAQELVRSRADAADGLPAGARAAAAAPLRGWRSALMRTRALRCGSAPRALTLAAYVAAAAFLLALVWRAVASSGAAAARHGA